jgi:hypothetical protein
MRRIYFLVPDGANAKKIVDELLLARIEVKHIHVIANHSLALEELPEATIAQSTDLIPSLERGLTIGGATGAVAGLAALLLPGVGILAGGAIMLASSLAGAGVGAWASSMIGISAPNSRLKEYEAAIERGEYLFMVDVPKGRVEEIEELVKSHHPEAEMHHTEPHIPAFP